MRSCMATDIIHDAEGAPGLIPSLHGGTAGLVAGGLIFLLLAVVLSKMGQRKLE